MRVVLDVAGLRPRHPLGLELRGLLDRLQPLPLDVAASCEIKVQITFFTGHMSGANWLPEFLTKRTTGTSRFPMITSGRITRWEALDLFGDSDAILAQARMLRAVVSAVHDHGALWSWDLGNETSNVSIPQSRAALVSWGERMASEIRAAKSEHPITFGIHMEDLEEDRGIGPAEAARYCDFVCMHGYPIYAGWAEGPTDHHLPPFLAQVTRWLSGGADVLFEEFGLPTAPDTLAAEAPLVSEASAAAYTARCLDALREAGCTGALLWCFSDYDEALERLPPLDLATHERSFGLWRADGSPKPALDEVTRRVGAEVLPPPAAGWLDIDPEEFRTSPREQLIRLYRRSPPS